MNKTRSKNPEAVLLTEEVRDKSHEDDGRVRFYRDTVPDHPGNEYEDREGLHIGDGSRDR